MGKFKTVNELVNKLKPDYPVYCIRPREIKKSVNFFKENKFEIVSNTYFDIESDVDIGKVDQNKLFEILSEIDHNQAQALFVSCTSLPVLNIIEKLEKKLNMIVLSSNQALIWETLEKINENKSITGFGSLFN